jgi:hypothetical protein
MMQLRCFAYFLCNDATCTKKHSDFDNYTLGTDSLLHMKTKGMKLITQTHLAYYNGQDADPQKAFKYHSKPIDIHICQYTNIRDLHTVTIDLDRFSSKTLDLAQFFQVANKNPICKTVSYELKSSQITNLNADIPLEAPITSCGNCFAIRNTSNLIIEGPLVSHTNKFSAYATIEI